jgi:Ca2+-binding RTX toxin-like protein
LESTKSLKGKEYIMTSSRRRAALCAAVNSAARKYLCEPLERRVLLDGHPVLVIVQPVQEYFDITTIDAVSPYLWRSAEEENWDPHDFDQTPPPWQGLEDEEGNGYAGDAYGWNFNSSTPNFILGDDTDAAEHGRFVTLGAVDILDDAKELLDEVKVRIMYVIGGGGITVNSSDVPSLALNYILKRKQLFDVNIVAVASALGDAHDNADRRGAQRLADAGIMLIGGETNDNTNFDPELGEPVDPFYSATPRFGVQQAPLDNILPITTDPRELDIFDDPILRGHGINSYYGGVATYREESFSGPAAAAMAAVAAQAYQEQHSTESPSIGQIKSAMMSGMDYISNLNNRTITHDYTGSARTGGGLFNLGSIVEAITDSPDIIGVSITPTPPNGTVVEFDLNSSSPPTNWTISWGDNSGVDNSGVQVLAGDLPSFPHTFPRDIQPHTYYPTIYAMLGTGDGRRVYLPAAEAQPVLIDTNMDPTSGKEDYVLSRSGNNLLVTLGSVTQTFTPGQLPRSVLYLGTGGDTVTIDFSNGDPLANTDLTIRSISGANNLVRVIGKPDDDEAITNLGTGGEIIINVNGTGFVADTTVRVSIDGGAGDDYLYSISQFHTTLAGGAGDDLINLDAGRIEFTRVEGGDGIDTVLGTLSPDVVGVPDDEDVEYYKTDDGNILVKRYDAENDLMFSLTQTVGGSGAGATTINIEAALNEIALDVSAQGALAFQSEVVPVNAVTSMIVNGQSKDEGIDIESTVNTTVNAANGEDYITVVSPNATIDGGSGNDTIYTGNTGGYFVQMGPGNNEFFGGNGTDYVELTSGATDVSYLGGGNDTVDALYDFGDDDYINGGSGHDTLLIWALLSRTNLVSIEEIIEV